MGAVILWWGISVPWWGLGAREQPFPTPEGELWGHCQLLSSPLILPHDWGPLVAVHPAPSVHPRGVLSSAPGAGTPSIGLVLHPCSCFLPCLPRWNTTVQTLVASYEAYEDLMKKSQEGKDFYTDLEGKAAKLLEKARAACQAAEANRQQILEK